MRVFGYCRVSTAAQQDGYSLDEQKERVQAYCKAMGWTVARFFVDGGESGAKINRPALQDMCSQIKEADKVVVYKLDRLSRSQKDTLYLIEEVFLKNGVDFVSVTENFDTSTPFGKAMVGILAVFAQLEREQIKERMMMGRAARAKEGKYCGQFRTAIGYEYKDGELVVNEAERASIETIFDMCIRGYSFSKIALELNNRGMQHHYGEWKRYTVRGVLRNPIYTGKVAFCGEYFPGNHEAIVSEDIFEKASEIADDRTKRLTYITNPGRATSYLAGLLVCKWCGKPYYRRDEPRRQPRYQCWSKYSIDAKERCKNKRWNRLELDALVFEEVKKLKLNLPPAAKKKQRNFDAEISKIDTQLERLVDLYALGTFSLDKLNQKSQELTNRKLEIIKQKEAKPVDVASLVNSFADILEQGTLQEVRAVLFQLIDHIELDGDNVDIFWKF